MASASPPAGNHHLWEKEGGVFIHHTSPAASIAELRRHGFLETARSEAAE